MSRDHRVKSSACPVCGHAWSGAFNPFNNDAPVPGDVSICIKCQSIAVFADDLSLRKPTEDEILEMPLAEITRAQKMLNEIKDEL